jgi:hypothetical protein
VVWRLRGKQLHGLIVLNGHAAWMVFARLAPWRDKYSEVVLSNIFQDKI